MNMKIYLLIVFVVFVLMAQAQPTKWKNKKYFTLVSYNVENLFDTIARNKLDEEFTPHSDKQWNSERYYKKLNNIAQVIRAVHTEELPEVIGLVEIENRSVLNDLVKTQSLALANYQIVHEDGPDPRGIDCAFLYNPNAFKYLSHQAIKVRFPFSGNHRTRDILYVKGLVKKDTVHFFVNHWSSRRGGQEESEKKRVQSALVLKHFADSLLTRNSHCKICIMGDFNDEPNDKSLNEALTAGKLKDSTALKNILFAQKLAGKGSYYYRGDYSMIDNLVVSNSLIDAKKGFRLYTNSGYIFNPEFICYTNKNGDKSPNRTYGGNNYYGGYSDHFPVYAVFYEK
jgi:predicted extracellular nuclease